jgi:hypothetical protein
VGGIKLYESLLVRCLQADVTKITNAQLSKTVDENIRERLCKFEHQLKGAIEAFHDEWKLEVSG